MVLLVSALTGCKQEDSLMWTDNIEPLQNWNEGVHSNEVSEGVLAEYVDLFVECHEEVADYGLAYGVTAVLCEEKGVRVVPKIVDDAALAEFFSDSEQLYLLDFTLPMFENYYFDEDTVKYVQAAAVSLVEYVSEQESLEKVYQLCLSENREEIAMWKNQWLEGIGVETLYEPYADLTFTRNDVKIPEEYPYVLSNTEANWYFHPDDVKEYGYKEFVREYLTIVPLVELDFAEARELFAAYLPGEVAPVDICSKLYVKEGARGGVYLCDANQIELYYNWEEVKHALLHEYVHYLTLEVAEVVLAGGPFAEGIAEEAAIWGCENRLRMIYLSNLYDEEQMKELHIWNEEQDSISDEGLVCVTARNCYTGVLVGRKYLTVTNNFVERPAKIEYIGQLSYEEMASLTHYLIELYGREQVYDNFYDYDTFMDFIGRDFLNLYDDWAVWNKEQCDNMGIQFMYE